VRIIVSYDPVAEILFYVSNHFSGLISSETAFHFFDILPGYFFIFRAHSNYALRVASITLFAHPRYSSLSNPHRMRKR
jgi:hypothetical protein